MSSLETDRAGRWLGWVAGLVLASLLPAPVHGQPLPSVAAPGYRPRIEPHQLWVLELRLGGRVLRGGVLAIDREGELLLPIHELAEAFELAVEVDPRRARAEGWLIHPQRGFQLDLGEDELRIEGGLRDLTPAHIVIWSQDIYVDSRTLSSWWPVDVAIDRRRLRIEATPRETLPVEKRIAREKLHARLGLGRDEPPAGGGEGHPYAWWSRPAMDVHLRSQVFREPHGRDHDWRSQYDVAAAGDLLRLRSEMLWTGVADEHSRLRLRAGRRYLEGPVREFTLGDVSTPSLGFLSQARGGRGFQISSFPLHYQSEAGQLTIEGDLRPGWEVEVYRDEVLLGFADSATDLRYRFEDLPTVPGLNRFRLVFHGPRGETREELRRIWADGGLAPAGEMRYRATLNQHEEDLLRFGEIGNGDGLRGELRAIGELEHGLGEAFTLAVGAASLPLRQGRHHYANAGARAQLWGSLLRTDVLASHDGGWASGASWQTRLRSVSLGLSHHEFRDFLSERTTLDGGELLLGRSEASLDGHVTALPLRLHYRIGVGASRLRGGRLDSDGQLRLSTFLRPVWLTHTLRTRIDRGGPIDDEFVDGELLASLRRGDFGLRSQLAYAANPASLTSAALIGDWTPHYLTSTRLGVTHVPRDRTAIVAGLSRRIGVLVLSANLELDDRGVAQAGVGISFGLSPDPHGRGSHWGDPGATRSGVLGARAFLDRNANGRLDEGESPLPEVGFVARGAGHARTGPDGTAVLDELPVDRWLDVAIDEATIEDPHWRTPRESERVVLRPGAPVALDFPVIPVGEVDGWVRDASRPLPGVSLQLLDSRGEIAHTTRSEIDGFYLFQEIPPGLYRLRVDPEQARRVGWRVPAERELVVRDAGEILSNQDLEIRYASPPPP